MGAMGYMQFLSKSLLLATVGILQIGYKQQTSEAIDRVVGRKGGLELRDLVGNVNNPYQAGEEAPGPLRTTNN